MWQATCFWLPCKEPAAAAGEELPRVSLSLGLVVLWFIVLCSLAAFRVSYLPLAVCWER